MKPQKTVAGQRALKERVPPLSPRQRSLLIVCDGQKSREQLIEMVRGLGGDESDLDHLASLGLIESVEAPPPPAASTLDAAAASSAARPAARVGPRAVSPEEAARRYQLAYPVATQLTASLGLRGFRLNLAVEKASGYAELVALLPQLSEALGADRVAELRRLLTEQ